MTTDGQIEPDTQPKPVPAAAFRLPVAQPHSPPRSLRSIIVPVAIGVVALVALGVSIYLASIALSGGSAGGCDSSGGASCDEVLSSRWSLWLTVPVSMLAVAVYGSVLSAIGFAFLGQSPQLARAAWSLLLVLSAMAFGAAVWFTSLQLFELGSVCKFCMTVHVCGVLLFVLVWAGRSRSLIPLGRAATFVAAGLLGTSVLIAGQIFYKPVMYNVSRASDGDHTSDRDPAKRATTQHDQADSSGDEPNESPPAKSRMLTLSKSEQTIDVHQHPIIGSPESKHILVKLFDYTCPHCRERHYQLETVRSRSHGRLAIVVLPVPLNKVCNKHAGSAAGTRHEQACVYARLAIAVWLADRTKFEEFHRWLFETKRPRAAKVARRYAIGLVGQGPLDEQLENFRVSELIGQYVEIYGKSESVRIPQLINDRLIIDGRFEDGKELGEVLAKEIGLELDSD